MLVLRALTLCHVTAGQLPIKQRLDEWDMLMKFVMMWQRHAGSRASKCDVEQTVCC